MQVLESSLFIERARMEHGGRCLWIFYKNEIEIEIDEDNLILRILGLCMWILFVNLKIHDDEDNLC